MAENDDAQEKTEEPSQRKLQKARDDGDILTSKESFVFATSSLLLALVPITAWFGFDILNKLAYFFRFERVDNGILLERLGISFWDVLWMGALIGVPIMAIVLLAQSLIGGLIQFSVKGFSFQANRINPIKGLQRIFSMKGLVELLKSIGKVVLLSAAGMLVLTYFFRDMQNMLGSSFSHVVSFFSQVYLTLIAVILVVLFVIAIIDYAYARYSRLNKLKMSRQELKDENKETDGSPEVKSRIRQLQIEASQRAREHLNSLENVSEATAIITNPTHFAVAIKFIPGEMSAPTVVSLGRGRLAETIITKAGDNSITIFSSPLLARALYYSSKIDQEIDTRLFAGVAAVLAYIFRLENGEELAQPTIEVPDELKFNEFGRPI